MRCLWNGWMWVELLRAYSEQSLMPLSNSKWILPTSNDTRLFIWLYKPWCMCLRCSWLWVKEFKRGKSGLFLTPVLTLWDSSHIDRHVWRWVIVPSDLEQTFSAICACYRYRVIHRVITIMRAWVRSTRERQLTLAWQA